MAESLQRPVLVLGATGYVGARLVPRLLEAGYRVRALARNPAKLAGRSWSGHPALEVVRGDLSTPDSLPPALSGCGAVYYLVHSMGAPGGDFAAADRRAAQNFVAAAAAAGVERIIHLSGLGDESDRLSEHLRSRAEVAEILRQGPVPATVLRAGVILGSGSASFEILRYLVERLPVMLTPRWIDTACQPVAIRNVLGYLVGCLSAPETVGECFDIGQEKVVNYRRLMEIYAEEAGLRRRWIIPVPLLTPRLSSLWIHLVTPVPASLARPLAEGLRNPVLCRDTRIRTLIPQELLDCRTAIRLALQRESRGEVESSWREAGILPPVEWPHPGDPDWSGGTVFCDCRRIVLQGDVAALWRAILGLGGARGWYFADWLWGVRGGFDRLLGGVGRQRGRRCPLQLHVGDALDFWRVAEIEERHHILLAAEMKVPGTATLAFDLAEQGEGRVVLTLTARFRPCGVAGLLYWYGVAPFHHLVFPGLLRGLAGAAGARVVDGPRRLPAAVTGCS